MKKLLTSCVGFAVADYVPTLMQIVLAKKICQSAQEAKKMIICIYGTPDDLYCFRDYEDIRSGLEKNEKGIK